MDVVKYDDHVRSLINGRLHGVGRRLSAYCTSVVGGGDIDELSKEFADDIDGYVEDGVREAWEQSEAMRREMEDEARVRKRRGVKDAVTTAALLLALQSFLSRKDRVLAGSMAKDFARQTRSVMPLLSGENAKERSRQLADYIKNPSRINIDKIELSKGETPILKPQPSLFSRMRRILVTDIATAYRTAEYHAWQLLPFVVGQEIRLGKKHPVPDICDDLQGIYPKDFKFIGWHPWCRCFARPIFSWESEEVTEMPGNFSSWIEKNAERIELAKKKGTLPQWMYENRKYVKVGKVKSLGEKVIGIMKPQELSEYVSFDPFSPVVIEKLKERKNLKYKLGLFEEILDDERAKELFRLKDARTVVFPGHKGSQHSTWKGIKQMAKDLNRHGESVVFLPEIDGVTSADALVLFRDRPTVADFKYCTTKKANTLAGDLEEGFGQASTIVVKLESMDAGAFNEAIDYLVRNDIPYGNIKVINKYGDFKEMTRKDIEFGAYKKKIKGFL